MLKALLIEFWLNFTIVFSSPFNFYWVDILPKEKYVCCSSVYSGLFSIELYKTFHVEHILSRARISEHKLFYASPRWKKFQNSRLCEQCCSSTKFALLQWLGFVWVCILVLFYFYFTHGQLKILQRVSYCLIFVYVVFSGWFEENQHSLLQNTLCWAALFIQRKVVVSFVVYLFLVIHPNGSLHTQ